MYNDAYYVQTSKFIKEIAVRGEEEGEGEGEGEKRDGGKGRRRRRRMAFMSY